MILDKYKLKLQMFADDDDMEDVEDGDLPEVSADKIVDDKEKTIDDVEVDDDDIDNGEEDYLEDEEDEEELDKKTKALIKYKQEAKEAKKKLAEMEEKLEMERLKDEESKRVDELKKEGISDDIAKRTAQAETKAKMMEAKLANYEYDSLKEVYPNIVNHKQDIEALREKYPEMTREELYLAKYYKNASFETKRNMEAELEYKKKLAKDKSLVDGVPSKKSSVKLTRSEEIAFKEVKKFNPKMTKDEFYKRLNEEEELDF